MARPVAGYLGYDSIADRPLVKLAVGTRRLLVEDDIAVSTNGFRLAPTSDDSIPSDGAFGTIYLAPVESDQIALFSSGGWALRRVSAAVSYALAGRTAGRPFDLFAYWSGSAVVLEAVDWASGSTRATGLTRTNGVWTKTGDATRRYVGTVRARSATTYRVQRQSAIDTGSAGIDYWNVANKRQAAITLLGPNTFYSYSGSAWRQAGGLANAQIEVIAGLAGDATDVRIITTANTASTSTTLINASVAVGVNSGTVPAASSLYSSEQIGRVAAMPADTSNLIGTLSTQHGLGNQTYNWLERADPAGIFFFGTGTNPSATRPGMSLMLWY